VNQDWGLIDFLLELSSKDAFPNFEVYCNNFETNSSISDLFQKDESSWYSNDELKSQIKIVFKNGWKFSPTSIQLKCGANSFPQSWKIMGNKYFQIINLLEIKEDFSFSYPFQEKSFSITARDFFHELWLEQTQPNSDGNNKICLSHFDFYGELRFR
jgi:hypothetical protein